MLIESISDLVIYLVDAFIPDGRLSFTGRVDLVIKIMHVEDSFRSTE
jgi:hypothetical protein